MNPEDQAKLDAALLLLAKLDAAQPVTLILVGVIAVCMVLVISGSNTFTTLRLLAVQSQFINAMTTRSVMANEQIRQSTDTQTTAMRGQTDAISAMNATGITTGAAVGRVDKKVDDIVADIQASGVDIRAINIRLGYIGGDIKNLAQHEVAPTATTQQKVEAIAEKPAGDTVVGRPEPKGTDVVPPAPKVGDEIPVTGQVTGVVTLTVDTPAVPT